MTQPTSKVLIAWWEAQPKGQRTCTDCGRIDDMAYVQPQHPHYADGRTGEARCSDCEEVYHNVLGPIIRLFSVPM